MNISKEVYYIWYVIAKLRKYVKFNIRLVQIPFSRGFFKNKKWLWTKLQATLLVKIFDKNYSFVIKHKLAIFHCQTVFTSQVIQQNVFFVSSLSIWWLHEIYDTKILKYLNISRSKKGAFEVKQKIF